MKKLYLLFLWHMHQPVYKNPLTGYYEMPWVFLHAIKDYYDMPWHVSRFKHIKGTFNLVPSLLEQLKEYSEGNVKDKLLELIKKEISSLLKEEKSFLIPFLFNANPTTMIRPFPRYYQLFLKKENFSGDITELFSNQEILDLEVLFLLSWTGNYLRSTNKTVKMLIEKGSDYTQEDKNLLLSELFSFLKEIIPFYKKLYSEGKIEISTTPFYHPILPLLLDMNAGKEATPEINLPNVDVSFKDDGIIHLEKALSYTETIFGKNLKGIWPAEGSISKETVSLFGRKNILWTASDEDVLFNSIGNREKGYVYKIYTYGNVFLFFRDKTLSDLIGFTYSSWDYKSAVDDFLERLKEIYNTYSFEPVVSIILDGENAWEFYQNNGFEFFNLLYKRLEKENWIEVLTFSDILKKTLPVVELENIIAGSWIGGNFYIWIGHPEKNKGWELLGKVKKVFNMSTEEKKEKARKYLLIAEGSDWFWWYGDDHYTPYGDKFDMLFRSNIQKVYDFLGVKSPKSVFIPIKKTFPTPYIRKPNYYVFPVIDGEVTHYFEWLHSGEINLLFDASSMDTSGVHLKKLFYGYDENNLYLRIDGRIQELLNRDYYLFIDFLEHSEKKFYLYIGDRKEVKGNCEEIEYLCKNVCEIKIPFSCLPLSEDKRLEVSFGIFKGDKQIEKVPFYNFIQIDLSQSFEDDWFV